MLKQYPYYLANQPVYANNDLSVTDKYSGKTVCHVAQADQSCIERAIRAAEAARSTMAGLSAYERQAILNHCAERFQQRSEELATTLCIEAGKPIRDARGEVTRLIETFRIAAEEAVRIHGETINLDISARGKGYQGITKRVPIGPCSFISPFNFPLNLVAHKVAPAIAAGCPFILKPASSTPIGALIIGEILAETNLPEGAFSILPCKRDGAQLFTEDPRLKLLSFTGSPDVGWNLKAKAGKKSVVLELGGNAACLVDADSDIEDAVNRIIIGAFYQSGQSCISVQRILVHQDIYNRFKQTLVRKTEQLISGDPSQENTFIGPLISEQEAIRLQQWIEQACSQGATLLCGGERHGSILEATILENVSSDSPLSCQEAFGPIATLSPFTNYEKALEEINNSHYGLQAGVFTRDLYKAQQAWDTLEVGGVIIGDVPSWRMDNMPYGGVKDSGMGREGVKYAIEHMTEPRLLVIRTPEK
jgi:acyl-CoA reductase-like NAD-dependent aldehyde dehydrogenase